MDKITTEINNHAKTNRGLKLSGRILYGIHGRDTNREEFCAFLGAILNMGTTSLSNMQENWSTKDNSRIPFFYNVFTRRRFNQIFWMLHLKIINPRRTDIITRIQPVNNFNQLKYFRVFQEKTYV